MQLLEDLAILYGNDKNDERICPKTRRCVEPGRERRWASWTLPFVGLVSLLWFLIRVIPKPSRATYPCQRAAFPLASGFVVWLTGIVVSSLVYRKVKRLAGQARYVTAGLFAVAAVGAIWWSISITTDTGARAAFVPSDPPNSPIGIGKGIFPGRVAWIHDPNATTWDGVTGHWWDEQNLNQQVVDGMVSRSLRALTGQRDDAAAWDALFRYFNRTHGAGDIGYQPGEKIAIKINLNEEGYGPAYGGNGRMPSPQMIHSLLAQLFDKVHVSGSNVTIYDASRAIADPLYNRIHGDSDPNFQNARFVANTTGNGRVGAVYDPASPVHFANPSVSPPNNATAYLPTCVTEAKYLIDMALLSGHSMYGVTACGKNWFGSVCWRTNAGYFPWNGGWTPSPLHNFGLRNNPMGSYNCIVDLIGHPRLGGKTLLFLVDGLYGSDNAITRVLRYSSFGNNWTASVFASQDSVAIDSVVVDFLRNEPLLNDICTGQGVDNYLHEAAQADNPPSGSFYDPASTGSRLASLGVHEHWNDSTNKQYSRNLDPVNGTGIELVTVSDLIPPVADFDGNERVDFNDFAIFAQSAYDGGELDGKGLAAFAEYWLEDLRLVAHWKLDERDDGIANDSAGDNDGTLHGDPNWRPTAGSVGGAIELDGEDDYVSTDFVLDPANGPFSVYAWVKAGAPEQVVISQVGETGRSWLAADSEGNLMTDLRAPAGRLFGPPLISDFLITDGDWHRIALVWDASCRRLYADGAEVAVDIEDQIALIGADGGLYFGAENTLSATGFFDGMIDDVRIYDQPVTP